MPSKNTRGRNGEVKKWREMKKNGSQRSIRPNGEDKAGRQKKRGGKKKGEKEGK